MLHPFHIEIIDEKLDLVEWASNQPAKEKVNDCNPFGSLGLLVIFEQNP